MMASGISLVYRMVQSMDPTFLQTPMALPKLLWLAILGRIAFGTVTNPSTLDACPGHDVIRASSTGSSLSADLVLAGNACNVFGKDVSKLKLEVTYETSKRCLQFLLAFLTDLLSSSCKSRESTLRLRTPPLNATKSPNLCFPVRRRITLPLRTLPTSSSTTPLHHSHFPCIAPPPLRFYSRPRLIPSYLSHNTSG